MKLSLSFTNNCANGTVMTIDVNELKTSSLTDTINTLLTFKRATDANFGIPPLEVANLLTRWADTNMDDGTVFELKVIKITSIEIVSKSPNQTTMILTPKFNEDGIKTGTLTVKLKT